MAAHEVPLIIRGRVILDEDCEYGGRRRESRFVTADVRKHLDSLCLADPSALADLYDISFDEVLAFLDRLADRLKFDSNPHLQGAFELSIQTSGLSVPILRRLYETMHQTFRTDLVRRMVDRSIGLPFLEGWVETPLDIGVKSYVRAFGARAVHVVAGNVPGVSAVTIVRGAATRSDIIIKTPSNDPLTAAAIARTMIDMDPDHPITRHVSVAYWKGGDSAVEETLYQPRYIEKIVAWGGQASISHIAKYIQPGIDLITFDPKLSSSIIGRRAFDGDAAMQDAAARLAHDVGIFNQEACLCARVIYVETGTGPAGIEIANRFGRMLFEAIQALPPHVSGPQLALDPGLKDEIEGLRFSNLYKLVGGGGPEGAVIVSQVDEPVEFASLLNNRVANLVPIDHLDAAVRATSSYTQTVGVHPPELADQLRDRLALHGAQKICSLGYAASPPTRALGGPNDGIEPLRRMCKWVVQDISDAKLRPLAAYTLGAHDA